MLTRSLRLPSSLLLILGLPTGAAAAGLEAGAARVDITPGLGLGMYGFASREGGATGVLDPLMAHVLVLEAGEKRLALVAMDLGEPPAAEWIRRLRENAAKTSGISYVLVAATHTHSGPRIRDEYPPKEAPDWESVALEKVGRAIDDAHRRRVEARIGAGYGTVHIGHNQPVLRRPSRGFRKQALSTRRGRS